MRKLKIFITRYSMMAGTGWVASNQHFGNMDEYRKFLFAPRRLALHERMFASVTLPSLVNQDRPMCAGSAIHMVLTSDELPEPFLHRLEDMLKPLPWARLIKLPAQENMARAINCLIKSELQKFDEPTCYATIRLDDDDALSKRFNGYLESYIDPCFSGLAVSFANGYKGFYDADQGRFTRFQSFYWPMAAMGLAYINIWHASSRGFDAEHYSVFGPEGNHTELDRRVPVILDSREQVFLRTIHNESDQAYRRSLVKKKRGADKRPGKVVLGLVKRMVSQFRGSHRNPIGDRKPTCDIRAIKNEFGLSTDVLPVLNRTN